MSFSFRHRLHLLLALLYAWAFDMILCCFRVPLESGKEVGSFLLSQIPKAPGNNIGLYRDDGLAITNTTPKIIENIKKYISALSKTKRIENHNRIQQAGY